MTGTRPVTLREVALAASVSTQTVSRVVNSHPDVAQDTRKRVQEVIDRLRYRPNAIARSLSQQRSSTLGLLIAELDCFESQRVLRGIEREALALGYGLYLCIVDHEKLYDVEHQMNRLLSQRVDGIMWAVCEVDHHQEWLAERARQLAVPVVYLGLAASWQVPGVSVDNEAGGHLATQHLIAQGRRQIGLITGPRSWAAARNRSSGWRRALGEAGLSAADRQIAHGDWTAPSGEQGLYQLVAQMPALDGVFACNDQMALGVLHGLHRLGRRVPDDVAVVGYDNMPEAAYFWPPLTTIHQHGSEQARKAVSLIDQFVQNQRAGGDAPAVSHEVLEPHLVIRASSATR